MRAEVTDRASPLLDPSRLHRTGPDRTDRTGPDRMNN
jgi:hypothetical protein